MSFGTLTGSRSAGARRGQSATMAIVLLFGVVALGSLGIMMVASETVTQIEHQSEEERIQQAFVELSQSMATASADDSVSHSMDFEAGESGAVTKTNAGTIRIEADGVDETLEMGAIEYESDDGTIIAYQAGGVWRETGSQTQMVSAPPVQYDTESETLTLPIATVSGQQDLTSGNLAISHNTTNPIENASVVEDDTVTLTITSDYYLGWKSYFETQAGDTVVRDVDHDNRTVKVELGYMDTENAFDSGVTFSRDYDVHQNANVNASFERGFMPPIDSVIEKMVEDARSGEMDVDRDLGTVDGSETLTNGTYYADGIAETGHLEFDLSDGNATLVVDGDIRADGSTITVTEYEEGNSLKVYSTGDFDARNGGNLCVDDCYTDDSAEIIQVYGTSSMQVDFGPGGNSRFEGLLYAASERNDWDKRNGCESQVCIHSNPNVYGSIVASSVEIQSSAVDFEYDTNLEDADIPLYPEEYELPPQITYLNLVVHEVDVENE